MEAPGSNDSQTLQGLTKETYPKRKKSKFKKVCKCLSSQK